MILTESPRRQQLTKMVAWGHWFTLANIVMALVISSIYIFSSPAPGSWLGNTYMVANWLGHISFITFISFIIFILPCCYLVTNAKAVRLSASIVAAIGLALLAFDALLFTLTGFHISFSSVQLVRTATETRIAEFGWKQWFYLLLLFVTWLGFQLVLANAIWQRLQRLTKFKFGPSVTSFFLTCFVASHGIHIWADAELYQPIVKQDNLFPLSYPATAKTTMSRYGLLDLDTYKQRKKLQFDQQVTSIQYPSEPIYCGIENNLSATVFVQTDDAALDITHPGLQSDIAFYSTATSLQNQIISTIFGVPEIYSESLIKERPVLLALPQAQGLDVSLSYDGSIEHSAIAAYQTRYAKDMQGLHIAFMPAAAIEHALTQLSFTDQIIFIATAAHDDTLQGRLYSNLPIQAESASNEDIAPTLLSTLGCQSSIGSYSTGRDLTNPSRNWIVSTSGERIIVIYDMQRIDVMSNGNYEIINLNDNTRSSEGLNVNLLSQAVKLLTQFSTKN